MFQPFQLRRALFQNGMSSKKDSLVPIFDFAQEYLHDKESLLIMYPAASVRHKSFLLGCCETYGFRIIMTWLGMNHLHLTSPADPKKTV